MVVTRSTMTSEGALNHLLGNVFGYPDDHQVRLALAYFGVNDINALTLFQDDDFTLPYDIPDPTDATKMIQTRLTHVYARRLNAVIKWFYQQPQQELATWFNLTADSFQTWYDKSRSSGLTPDIPDVPVPPPPEIPTTPKTFRSNIKITISDYPKLKEDKHWRTYNRLLQATAANHDTLQVLDDTYIPAIEDEVTFQQKQYFMYNVFTQTLNTSKGRLCV
jgi:hypothetical protein